jgi:hypothetical protein
LESQNICYRQADGFLNSHDLYPPIAISICKPPFYLKEWSLVVAEKNSVQISQAKM